STTSGKAEEMEESSFSSMASGMTKEGTLSKPIQIYKIYVADGREELVRSTQLGGVGISAFKNLLGVSGKQFAYNTLLPQNAGGLGSIFFMFSSMAGDIWSLAGIPASFIVPDAVLLDEVEVQQEKRPITIKKPVVENPVGK
ncbi:MAG: hypothetical protein HY738_18065, partial [Bacteroidia bacterium]|nr:hypothetical protein [Bacteroidia bacterium]